jgi:hypothetical protein
VENNRDEAVTPRLQGYESWLFQRPDSDDPVTMGLKGTFVTLL